MPTIRSVYRKLADEIDCGHPFAHKKLCLFGKTVLERMVNDEGVEELREVLTGQHGMTRILEKFLTDIDYNDRNGFAERWNVHPGVVIDPARNLGKPVSSRSGVGTFVLAQAFLANGSDADLVADLYDTSAQAVREAVAFEEQMEGRRAA